MTVAAITITFHCETLEEEAGDIYWEHIGHCIVESLPDTWFSTDGEDPLYIYAWDYKHQIEEKSTPTK